MKLVKTTFFSAVIAFIRIASGFVAGKVVAVFTGPGGVALIGAFINFITIVLTLGNGAINTGIVKYTSEYASDVEKTKKLFSTGFRISIICSSIVGSILLLSASVLSKLVFANPLYTNPIRVFGVTIILYALNSLMVAILNGKRQIRQYTIVNAAGSLIGLLLTIALVYFMKIEGALYSLVLTQTIVFFITASFVVKSPWFSWSYFKLKFNWEMGKKLGGFSLMAIISAITIPLPQLILRHFLITRLGPDPAGYWQAMMRISDGYLLLLTTSLSTYYLPKLSSLKTSSELKKEIFHGYKLILPTVFISCTTIYLLRFIIIKVLFTTKFMAMEELFTFQLLGDFFKMAAWVLSYLMLARAMTRLYIITELFFSASFILVSLLLVNRFGLIGTTYAFCLNYMVYFVVMLVIFRKILFKRV